MSPVESKSNILVVDDMPANLVLLADLLVMQGYDVATAPSGSQALETISLRVPDLVLLDVSMPGMDGIEVLQRIRQDARIEWIPVVMVTALEDQGLRRRALEAGADDFLPKPVDKHELRARVRSLLRLKQLHDENRRQAAELRQWNEALAARVNDQVAQLGRLSQLKRFFSPRLVEQLIERGDELLASHRREIVVVFLDLRGFTAFAEVAEPEDIMLALGEFHAAMGRLIERYEGTLERFTGDGMMVFFNDPLPVPDACERALRMAVGMQAEAGELMRRWKLRGFELGLGIGVAQGYATLGRIGFESRIDYGAIGAVTNLAARLCATASGGDILATRRVCTACGDAIAFDAGTSMTLTGFSRPIDIARVLSVRQTVAAS